MYSEKTFKNYIFWIQVKRVFMILIFSSVGAGLGVLIGGILKNTLKILDYNNLIIIVSTIVFFLISLLLTSGTGKEVQDGYWKIAVLRKLTVIQKDIEINNELLANSNKSLNIYKEITGRIKSEMLNDEVLDSIAEFGGKKSKKKSPKNVENKLKVTNNKIEESTNSNIEIPKEAEKDLELEKEEKENEVKELEEIAK
ncbi:MAG: hypothetical protein HFJ45_06030 [Clostridia bacterium]|nr:hypothetical protein [Clostridia bacterium]